jgi:DNA phosphorothioation-dependent restriction protein DptG
MFGDILRQVETQRAEIGTLRSQLQEAARQAVEDTQSSSTRMQMLMEVEQEAAEAERSQLFSKLKSLIEETDQKRADRIRKGIDGVKSDMTSSSDALELARASYSTSMDIWDEKEGKLVERITTSHEGVDNRMRCDWTVSDLSRSFDPCGL